MEKGQITETIRQLVDATKQLDEAKADYKLKEQAVLELNEWSPMAVRALKQIAKATAAGKLEQAKAMSDELSAILEVVNAEK